MMNLSKRTQLQVARDYQRRYALRVRWVGVDGLPLAGPGAVPSPVARLPRVAQAVADALQESVRWGEPQVFFLAPGVLSWIVPLVQGEGLVGGLLGGEVVPDEDPLDRTASVEYLRSAGCPRAAASRFVAALTPWAQPRIREAAPALFDLFYQISGWRPLLLQHHRENAAQQRQIAEEIHQRKVRQTRVYPVDEEKMLLSLIRVGDKKGARRVLNKLLAAMFLYSPKLAVVRARAIEMMGYLVRAAVEDSPLLETLIERSQGWIERIVVADDFDTLCEALRDALDEFMDNIFLQGFNRTNAAVHKALDYIAAHYTGDCTLAQVARAAGLSPFRISHLLKEYTGRSLLQHVKRLRVHKAQQLLEQTQLSCAEIAYEVGFKDQSYLIKQFRSLAGITPARYRRERRVAAAPAG